MQSIIFLLFSGIYLLSPAQVWSDHSRIYPDKLRGIPTALMLYHSPSPNYPELNDTDKAGNAKYVWKHETCVMTTREDLQVVEAGSFIWMGDQGWFPNMSLNRKMFARNFNCPAGKLEANTSYCFRENYRYGDQLFAGDALWYVLAQDDQGKLYKGVGIIETEGELRDNTIHSK